ncbi:flagellar biosynthetic protein FliP [Rhodothalassium salexigens DSM 2132]|uniref:Flagellar biosynthetic protein FliP n=1 Tax=Rhodothalassium salexigens DSM 2132 TaxID=1188247 RepID=A0A4V2SNU8_RHOSA|nr:flagellar type III secretion system pore protein FliP [Rhodothalassium salexigens]MBB4212293.1 flagellar biosynthetic protein FliP [Rhodothalassium salexigens DSM 2132]MBK1638349.1 flagellar biosynthetic protein FliP [Rhodothalassium salexigens DSM 2132]TCP32556.1 flagellar biosynthetic protein FliP [Rhodothalassium salexigens DSM 2132]
MTATAAPAAEPHRPSGGNPGPVGPSRRQCASRPSGPSRLARIAQVGRRAAAALGVVAALALAAVVIFPGGVAAQEISVDLGAEGTLTGRVIQMLLLITVLSLAPSILLTMTSFTRIVVVLSILRNALGTRTTPPNVVMIALALFLTGYIMAPVFQQSYTDGIQPLVNEEIDTVDGLQRAVAPFRTFMLANVREADLELFVNMGDGPRPETPDDIAIQVLLPAFVISELRRAFEMAFLIYLPFIIIDLVVASVLMSMGMMMLPPVMISIPFKVIFFVLVDGWNMLSGSLVQSFNTV